MPLSRILALALALMFAAAGATTFTPPAYACAEGTADPLKAAQAAGHVSANFTTLTRAQLAAMLRRKDFYFVNVHIPYEGEIRNTDVFVDYDKIAENLDKLPRDKSHKILLYCRSGHMSEIAARELIRLGYSQVSHLSGGMIDWKKSGYEIIEK